MTDNFISILVCSCNVRNVRRRRHILDNAVQHLLYTFIFVSGSTIYRNRITGDGSLAEGFLQVVNGRLFALKVLLQKIIIQLTDLLNQIVVPFLCLILQIIRDGSDLDIFALIIFVIICLHLKQIDEADETVFFSDRNLNRNRILAQTVNDRLYRIEEVCTHLIHLVDESHTRYIVSVCLTPHIL